MLTVTKDGKWQGKTTVVQTPTLTSSVCTVRLVMLAPLRTYVCRGAEGYSADSILGQVEYSPELTEKAIFAAHDELAKAFDAAGSEGLSLIMAAGAIAHLTKTEAMGSFKLLPEFEAAFRSALKRAGA